jgi:type III pantothenate kinase
MLYTLDIGNTNIKLASFVEDKLSDFVIVKDLQEISNFIIKDKNVSIAFCSVVPEKSNQLKGLAKRDLAIEPFEVKLNSFTNIKISYETPNTLGLDRICSLEGALYLSSNLREEQKFNESSIILTVDFGTATTINFLSYPNNFIGGLISPGIHVMINSLNTGTAQLPVADVNDYKGLIGTSTNSSISSGIINATIGLIEKVISYLKNERKTENLIIYITGGNARLLMPFLKFNFIYEKALINYGIKNIFSRKVT